MRACGYWAVVIGLLLAAGCSRIVPKLDEVLPDKRTAYKKSESLPDLEVPPELSTDAIQDRMAIPEGGRTASYSTYQQRRSRGASPRPASATKPEGAQVTKQTSGETEQILVVVGEPSAVWSRLREFWLELGYRLDLDDPVVSTMQTDWRENGVDLTRDRFKLFVEPGEKQGTTLLFFSHEGETLSPKGEELLWSPRPRDRDIEAKLAERLRDFVASGQLTSVAAAPASEPEVEDVAPAAPAPVAQARVAAAPEPTPRVSRNTTAESSRAELISAGEGKLYLALEQDFALAWRSTGLALDQAGVTIEQADKSQGVYYIRYLEEAAAASTDKKKRGWSRLAFWRRGDGNEQFQLSLTGVGDKTEVVVLNESGKWDTSETASDILVRLHEELKKLL